MPLLREVLKQKKRLEENLLIRPTLRVYESYLKRFKEELGSERKAAVKVLDYLTEIMKESQPLVEKLIEERKRKGKIKNPDQARKTIAGNNFQGLVLYSLIKNVELLNLPDNLILLKTKNHELVKKHATIKVSGELQKPDLDLIVFSTSPEKPIVIFSCKTSLRERAGQTYRWKLLIDIAKNCPTLKKKYLIEYPSEREVKVGLITADFYDELQNPQQRGMITFFDFAYATKPSSTRPFSLVIDDLSSLFR